MAADVAAIATLRHRLIFAEPLLLRYIAADSHFRHAAITPPPIFFTPSMMPLRFRFFITPFTLLFHYAATLLMSAVLLFHAYAILISPSMPLRHYIIAATPPIRHTLFHCFRSLSLMFSPLPPSC